MLCLTGHDFSLAVSKDLTPLSKTIMSFVIFFFFFMLAIAFREQVRDDGSCYSSEVGDNYCTVGDEKPAYIQY